VEVDKEVEGDTWGTTHLWLDAGGKSNGWFDNTKLCVREWDWYAHGASSYRTVLTIPQLHPNT
jgi:hypothetical protein